jgi:diguanylate cyclase (GGDEF)-like protein/PAS domain S-box-containing protein
MDRLPVSAATPQKSLDLIAVGLPAKITGIVFWGLMILGLLLAFFMLQGRDQEISKQNMADAAVLERELVDHLSEQNDAIHNLKNSDEILHHVFAPMKSVLHFEAVSLNTGNRTLLFGSQQPDQIAITRTLLIHPSQSTARPYRVQMMVFFPSQKNATADYRKKILISIGLTVVVFGLMLQKILQHLLSRPFLSMVTAAKNFTGGNISSRFDEMSNDEFGFLARFINQALNSIVQQQQALREALGRATQSEADLFREKERAEVTLQSITEAVITTNAVAEVQYLNPAAERLTGWRNGEAHGLPLGDVINIVHENTGEPACDAVLECLKSNNIETFPAHSTLLRRDGEKISIEGSAAPMRNDLSQVIGAVMVCQDVSQARKLAHQLSYQASHDALTGLYNRLKFEEHLNQLLTNVEPRDQHALLYLDLDQFKIVNDTCGHMAGDELLRQLATVLLDCIRRGDILARLGGDEFGVLLGNCNLIQAEEIAEKMRHQVKEFRFAWHDKIFEIGASIGVVGITTDNLNAANILSNADLACYAAKDRGRNRVHVFHPTDDALTQRHGEMRWTTLITQALEQNRFVLYCQPISTLSDSAQHINHWEILIRMQGEDGNIIPPDSFIPAAERYNKMHSIDRWVIHNVFSAITDGCFSSTASDKRVIAINLSGASLGDEGMLSYIRTTSEQFGISLHQICFEITETVAISNLTKATHFINELKKLGCRFSLDDFGSGLSSFGYLKNLPVDYIKIDGGFVKDMATDPIDHAMVEAINQIGHVMKIQSIAEWVENEETLSLLKQIGVDFAQGYHIGKPVPLRALP